MRPFVALFPTPSCQYSLVDDNVYRGTRTLRISAFVASTRRDMLYSTVRVDVLATIVDNDVPGVVLSFVGGSVAEGATGSFTVRCKTIPIPGSVVYVTLTPSGVANVTLSATTLQFTSDAATTVTFVAAQDFMDKPDGLLTIVATVAAPTTDAFYYGSGVSTMQASGTITVVNVDTADVVIADDGGHAAPFVDLLQTVPGGVTRYVLLTSIPSSPVTVTLTPPTGAAFTVSHTTLVLTSINCCAPSTANAVQFAPIAGSTATTLRRYNLTAAVGAGSDANFAASSSASQTVSVTVTDIGVIAPSSLWVEEGSAATFSLQLTTTPAEPVVITLSFVVPATLAGAALQLSLSQPTVTLTTADAVTVSVFLNHNNVVTGMLKGSLHLDIAASVASGFHGVTKPDMVLYLNDDDVPSVRVSPTTAVVLEGEQLSCAVAMGTMPLGPVSVALAAGSHAGVTIASPASPQLLSTAPSLSLVLNFADDHVKKADAAYALTFVLSAPSDPAYDGLTVSVVTTEVDADVIGVTATASVELQEGSGAYPNSTLIAVTLPSIPSAAVSVSFPVSMQYTLTPVAGSTISPANWNVPLLFSVAVVNDAFDEGDMHVMVTAVLASVDASWNGLQAVTDVLIHDNDVSGVEVDAPAGGIATTEGGAPATYRVRLTSQPYVAATGAWLEEWHAATVALAPTIVPGYCVAPYAVNFRQGCATDDDCVDRGSYCNTGSVATAAPASVVFTSANWNAWQIVAVTAAVDAFVEPVLNFPVTLSIAAATTCTFACRSR